MTDSWTTIRYRDGFGGDSTVELTLSADRYARLIRSEGSASSEFTGRLESWVLPELRGYLRKAGFPSLPKDPTGEYRGLLSVAGEGSLLQAWVSLEHCQQASIGQALELIEGVMRALTDKTKNAHGSTRRSVLAE